MIALGVAQNVPYEEVLQSSEMERLRREPKEMRVAFNSGRRKLNVTPLHSNATDPASPKPSRVCVCACVSPPPSLTALSLPLSWFVRVHFSLAQETEERLLLEQALAVSKAQATVALDALSADD